jgi:hypothetical protein
MKLSQRYNASGHFDATRLLVFGKPLQKTTARSMDALVVGLDLPKQPVAGCYRVLEGFRHLFRL